MVSTMLQEFPDAFDEKVDLPIKPNGGAHGAIPSWRDRIFTAAELQTMKFPELKFILPGIVPEGATLLVSRPKLGKSWLVLDLALATAADRFTLGELKPPSVGDVLYLALEDGRRRLQRRITKLLPTFSGEWPERLKIVTEWRRANEGGLTDIEDWIKRAQSPRLIIIDTLAQFRRRSNGKTTPVYEDDCVAISDLQKLASKYNIGIIIVHHDRKAEADDVFDTVSGSLGLTGGADTVLIMKRRSGTVTLHVRGRDVEESEIALHFNKETCRWLILGPAAEVNRSAERTRVLSALEAASEPLGIKEIMAATERPDRNAVDQLLYKMVNDGEIEKVGRGKYQIVGKIGKKERCGDEGFETTSELADLTDLTDLAGSGKKERCGHETTSDTANLTDLTGSAGSGDDPGERTAG
jgi:AAA domain